MLQDALLEAIIKKTYKTNKPHNGSFQNLVTLVMYFINHKSSQSVFGVFQIVFPTYMADAASDTAFNYQIRHLSMPGKSDDF